MRKARMLTVAAVAGLIAVPAIFAQDPPPPSDPAVASAPAESPDQIRKELNDIKKGRTFAIVPAEGTDDSDGETLLRIDNPSPFDLVVLVVGPTTTRVEVGADHMQTLTLEPGQYEIAVTVVGRDLPPFYGKQTITPNLFFRQKFVIPAV